MTEAQKTRSPQQLEILAKARAKAQIVRKENAELKRKEKELTKAEKEKEKADRKKSITERYAKLKDPPKEPLETEEYESDDTEVVEQPVVKPKPKPKVKKTKKRVVVVPQSESDTDEEEEVVYVAAPRKKKAPKERVVYAPEHSPAPPDPFGGMYEKMFKL